MYCPGKSNLKRLSQFHLYGIVNSIYVVNVTGGYWNVYLDLGYSNPNHSILLIPMSYLKTFQKLCAMLVVYDENIHLTLIVSLVCVTMATLATSRRFSCFFIRSRVMS